MPEACHIRTTSRVPSKPKRQAATPFDTKLLELGKRFGKTTRAIDAGWDQPEDERRYDELRELEVNLAPIEQAIIATPAMTSKECA